MHRANRTAVHGSGAPLATCVRQRTGAVVVLSLWAIDNGRWSSTLPSPHAQSAIRLVLSRDGALCRHFNIIIEEQRAMAEQDEQHEHDTTHALPNPPATPTPMATSDYLTALAGEMV